MPWRVETSMSIRREFVEECARGLYAMSKLCARYGVSRRVGYKWLARYEVTGVASLEDQRRVAAHYPNRMADDLAAALLACRQAHPTWGARLLALRAGDPRVALRRDDGRGAELPRAVRDVRPPHAHSLG